MNYYEIENFFIKMKSFWNVNSTIKFDGLHLIFCLEWFKKCPLDGVTKQLVQTLDLTLAPSIFRFLNQSVRISSFTFRDHLREHSILWDCHCRAGLKFRFNRFTTYKYFHFINSSIIKRSVSIAIIELVVKRWEIMLVWGSIGVRLGFVSCGFESKLPQNYVMKKRPGKHSNF